MHRQPAEVGLQLLPGLRAHAQVHGLPRCGGGRRARRRRSHQFLVASGWRRGGEGAGFAAAQKNCTFFDLC